MAKKPRGKTLIGSQHLKSSKTLFKSLRQYFCHILWSNWKKFSSKKSFLSVSEILRLFVNILAPDEKYSLSVKAKVEPNQFKYKYLEIEKIFLNFFLHLGNLHKISNTLEKDGPQRLFVSEYIDCKKRRVRTLMGSQHVKGCKTLLKSARQDFCHIFWSL